MSNYESTKFFTKFHPNFNLFSTKCDSAATKHYWHNKDILWVTAVQPCVGSTATILDNKKLHQLINA